MHGHITIIYCVVAEDDDAKVEMVDNSVNESKFSAEY